MVEIATILFISLPIIVLWYAIYREKRMVSEGVNIIEVDDSDDVVAVPYSDGSSRVVFLKRYQIPWWNSLTSRQKAEVWKDIQDAVKRGDLEYVKDDSGKIIGIRNGQHN
jgi:hypothetical protein